MINLKNLKRYNALSLVEMLVVLLIVSTTVLSAFSLIIRSNLEIKENEIRDSINGVLVGINDVMSSNNEVSILNFTPVVFTNEVTYGFSVNSIMSADTESSLNYVGTGTEIDSCSESSPYYFTQSFLLNSEDVYSDLQSMCLQVLITPLLTTPRRYEVRTVVVYSFNNGNADPIVNNLITYRYGDFEIQE
jgi:type II secretory pathway pseudopilin PulG